jgi:LacI family transcriptional regulator
LREAGLPADGHWESVSDDPELPLGRLVRRLLDLAEPPTAFVGGNNIATISIVRETMRLGVEVGLVGFDDVDIADFFGISVIAQDTVGLGRAAARMAFNRLKDPTGIVEHVELPVTYIPRGSGERPPAS